VARAWRVRFDSRAAPSVQAERDHQRRTRPRRVGRPEGPLGTRYLGSDDSTLARPKGTTMEGVGHHYSGTAGARVRGHSLVQALYVLPGRRCPLAPHLYQQKGTRAARGILFRSKVAPWRSGCAPSPMARTLTHVLLDSGYGVQSLWEAAQPEFPDHHRPREQPLAARARLRGPPTDRQRPPPTLHRLPVQGGCIGQREGDKPMACSVQPG